MSASDPTGTGARTATPSNRPRYSGSALVVAIAAPVDVGHEIRSAGPASASVRVWSVDDAPD